MIYGVSGLAGDIALLIPQIWTLIAGEWALNYSTAYQHYATQPRPFPAMSGSERASCSFSQPVRFSSAACQAATWRLVSWLFLALGMVET